MAVSDLAASSAITPLSRVTSDRFLAQYGGRQSKPIQLEPAAQLFGYRWR